MLFRSSSAPGSLRMLPVTWWSICDARGLTLRYRHGLLIGTTFIPLCIACRTPSYDIRRLHGPRASFPVSLVRAPVTWRGSLRSMLNAPHSTTCNSFASLLRRSSSPRASSISSGLPRSQVFARHSTYGVSGRVGNRSRRAPSGPVNISPAECIAGVACSCHSRASESSNLCRVSGETGFTRW